MECSAPVTSPPPPIKTKHSGMGIASLVIGILVIILLCFTFTLAMAQGGNPNMSINSDSLLTFIGLLTCGTIMLSLVGVGLGIAAIIQKNVKKVFGIIGLVLNGVSLLGLGGITILGLLAS